MILETIVGLHLYSYHLQNKEQYENVTPGVYVSAKVENWVCMPSAGIYSNSQKGTSTWLGCTFEAGPRNIFRLTTGVVFGYEAGTLPLIVPSLNIPLAEKVRLNIGYIPKGPKQGSDAVHFAVERSF